MKNEREPSLSQYNLHGYFCNTSLPNRKYICSAITSNFISVKFMDIFKNFLWSTEYTAQYIGNFMVKEYWVLTKRAITE
jgi:hypothetical protein